LPDINGVLRTPSESFFSTIEILITSILFGFVINHLLQIQKEEFHARPYFHYWLVIDSLLMMITIGYVYLAKYLSIEGEMMKNVYTLIFLQEKKIREIKMNILLTEEDERE